jgi:CheY-like chemotaxis protein
MRDLVGETLPDADFQVTCYESGKAAFETIRVAEPMKYAAVSDFQTAGHSGIDLLRQVKQTSRICQ